MGLKLKGAVGHADPSFFVQKIPRRMVPTTKNPINPVFRYIHLRHLTVDMKDSFPPKRNIRSGT